MRKSFTIYQQLLLYTVGLLGVTFLLFVLAAEYTSGIYDRYMTNYLYNEVQKISDQLKTEDYNHVAFDATVFDRSRTLEIVNEKGRVVYLRHTPTITLSATQLMFIDEADESKNIQVTSYVDASQEPLVLVNVSYSDGTHPNDIYLLRKNGTVIFSNVPDTIHFTWEDVQFLTNDQAELVRYEFTTNSGQTRYLIASMDADTRSGYRIAYQRNVHVFVFLTLGIVLVILGYVSTLRRHMIRPLQILNSAIRKRQVTGPENPEKKGSAAEYQQIFQNFSDMLTSLKKETEQREKLEAERSELLSDISHDLKTPITVIQGYTRALKDGMIAPEETGRIQDIICRKVDYLNNLINQFYEYSKLDHPEFRYQMKRTELREFLRVGLADKYNEFQRAGLAIQADLDGAPVYVLMDQVQFQRAIQNILNNSIAHNETGTILKVSLSVSEALYCDIRIEDNGVGISPEVRENLFEPFVVTDASRSHSGTGLGLAISRRIIRDHHGTVALADPSAGFSTCFEICLPLAEEEQKEAIIKAKSSPDD